MLFAVMGNVGIRMSCMLLTYQVLSFTGILLSSTRVLFMIRFSPKEKSVWKFTTCTDYTAKADCKYFFVREPCQKSPLYGPFPLLVLNHTDKVNEAQKQRLMKNLRWTRAMRYREKVCEFVYSAERLGWRPALFSGATQVATWRRKPLGSNFSSFTLIARYSDPILLL